jgi:hypothetical protein
MSDRRSQLRQLYGLDFPDDLFAFWDRACELNSAKPREAFEVLSAYLCGPFDVLAGKYDSAPSEQPLWLKDRSYQDPPEFFTILWGNIDGLHRGYWFDDPGRPPGCIASYYNNDAYDLAYWPATLFETLRCLIEWSHDGVLENRQIDPEHRGHYDRALEEIDRLRQCLNAWVPGLFGKRKQRGWSYPDRYQHAGRRKRSVVARTWGRESIVVPRKRFRAPGADDEAIWREVRQADGAARWTAVAEQALADGYPGTALKLGKDLWRLGGKAVEPDACRLMEEAYRALGRPLLAEVLQGHRRQRDRWDAERAARRG